MTNIEFSDEFDELVKIKNIQQEFNEYDKSILLTKAQEMIVLGLYSGKLTGHSFEEIESLRRYLNAFVKQSTISPTDIENVISKGGKYHHSIIYDDSIVWFIIYEECVLSDKNDSCIDGSIAEVIPVTHDQYSRTVDNPFRGPTSRRVLRLDNGKNNIELISTYKISNYTYRYIKKPTPIILTDLPKGLSIEGLSIKQECQAPQELHRMILDQAILLAQQSASTNNINNNDQ